MSKLLQTTIAFILTLLASIALANDCNVLYDHEYGDVVLPCVIDQSGNFYFGAMQRKSDGDFQVIVADKFEKAPFPAKLQKAELISENLLLVMIDYIIPVRSCGGIIENFSTVYGSSLLGNNTKIQIKILRRPSETSCDLLYPEGSVTAAQVIKVLPGIDNDIYINDELKETVKVPLPK